LANPYADILKAARGNIAALLPILDHALEKIKGDPSDCGAR